MPGRPKPIRSRVILSAFGKDGEVIEAADISYDDYYGGMSDLVDSSDYRAKRGIRSVKGKIFGSRGNMQQDFEIDYDERGQYVRSRTVHEDGTVIED